jgi:hypothetical protein
MLLFLLDTELIHQHILSDFDKELRKLTKNRYFSLLDKFQFVEIIKIYVYRG